MADKPIATVTHYYDRIGVAVIKLNNSLAVGDAIKIQGPQGEFTQKVESIQLEHKQLESAKKGQEVGLKVDQPVKGKNLVFKA